MVAMGILEMMDILEGMDQMVLRVSTASMGFRYESLKIKNYFFFTHCQSLNTIPIIYFTLSFDRVKKIVTLIIV